jgi:spore coat protein U-like protein
MVQMEGELTRNLILAACAMAAATAVPAGAATTTTTMAVSATVQATCSLSASALSFGTYTSTQLDAASSLSVTCTSTTPYTISLNAGNGSGATVATRKMTSAGNTLNYTLYSDSSRSALWGQTVNTDTVAGTGSGSAQSLAIYGRIAAGQAPVPAIYSDLITATITY